MKHWGIRACVLLLTGCLLVGALSGCTASTEQTAADTASGSAQTAGSGVSGSAQPSASASVSLPGTWVLVMIESDGLQMTGAAFEDLTGCTMVIALTEDGTGELTYTYSDTDSDAGVLTWERQGNTLTLTPTDTDSAALSTELGDNCFALEDADMTMLFAKEGTDATDPTLYLANSTKPFVGTWESQTVRIDGGEAQESLDGSAVSGMIRLTLNDDLSAEVSSDFGAESVTTTCWWALKDGMAILTDDALDFRLTAGENDTLLLSCEKDDVSYEFTCARTAA